MNFFWLTVLTVAAIGVVLLGILFYRTKLFPWLEKRAYCYPKAIEFIKNDRAVRDAVGDVIDIEPIFHTMEGYTIKKIGGDYEYLESGAQNFKLKVTGNSGIATIRLTYIKRGSISADFSLVDADMEVLESKSSSKTFKKLIDV